jgi:Fanconi anemia group M protein
MRSKRTPGGGYRKSVNGGYTGAAGSEGEGPRRRDWFPSAGEMVTLVADAAQKGNKILDALTEKKARILYANLQVGDYQITDNIYISYMSSDEFVRALTDKRLYRQVLELKRACPEPMVIVEGPSVYENAATNANIVNGALAFISVLNRIPLVFTADAEESADILFMATNQMQFGLGYEVHAEDQRKRKRELREIQHDVLTTLPGVGPNLAKALLKQFGSLQAVFNATPESLAEVQGFEDGQRETLLELFALKG